MAEAEGHKHDQAEDDQGTDELRAGVFSVLAARLGTVTVLSRQTPIAILAQALG